MDERGTTIRDGRRAAACALALGVGLAALPLLAPRPTTAGCNVIPVAPDTFRGAVGFANRPFAGPRENVEIAVRPERCDTPSPGLRSRRVDDYVVSVIFGGGAAADAPRTLVAVATSCATLAPALAACGTHPALARVTCVEANRPGGPRDLALVLRGSEQRLMVRFPDTDHLVGAPGDGRTLVGPATLAVTTAGAPLPCALAATRCADAGEAPGLVACLDELYRRAGDCTTAEADRDPTFAHFTALPPVNDYRTILAAPGNGADGDTEIRFALDARGTALIPIDWRGALIEKTSSTVTRQLRGLHTVEAFLGLAADVDTLGAGVVTSYDLRGAALPPLYRPDAPAYQETLFGTIDVPRSVVRIAGHVCPDGTPCGVDTPCARGTCRALFGATPAVADGGPRVIPRRGGRADQRQACVLPEGMSLVAAPGATL